jgi:hypothetical protein
MRRHARHAKRGIQPRTIEIFDYIDHIQITEYRTPTYREIAAHFGMVLSVVAYHINRLCGAGWAAKHQQRGALVLDREKRRAYQVNKL